MDVLGKTATDPTAPPALTAFTATATNVSNAVVNSTDNLLSKFDPFNITLKVGQDGTLTDLPSLENLLKLLKNTPPPLCQNTYQAGSDCVAEENIITPTGEIQPNLKVGDEVIINHNRVLLTDITNNGGGRYAGEGLVHWEFGLVFLPVYFDDIYVLKPTSGEGGCVKEGEFIVKGSDNSILDRDEADRLQTLMAKMNDPTSFSGLFPEVVKKMTPAQLATQLEKMKTDLANTLATIHDKFTEEQKEKIKADYAAATEELKTSKTAYDAAELALKNATTEQEKTIALEAATVTAKKMETAQVKMSEALVPKETYYVKDLVAIDVKSPTRKAKATETLYLVKDPNLFNDSRLIKYQWNTNAPSEEMKKYITLGSNPIYSLNGKSTNIGINSNDALPYTTNCAINGLGYNQSVKVIAIEKINKNKEETISTSLNDFVDEIKGIKKEINKNPYGISFDWDISIPKHTLETQNFEILSSPNYFLQEKETEALGGSVSISKNFLPPLPSIPLLSFQVEAKIKVEAGYSYKHERVRKKIVPIPNTFTKWTSSVWQHSLEGSVCFIGEAKLKAGNTILGASISGSVNVCAKIEITPKISELSFDACIGKLEGTLTGSYSYTMAGINYGDSFSKIYLIYPGYGSGCN